MSPLLCMWYLNATSHLFSSRGGLIVGALLSVNAVVKRTNTRSLTALSLPQCHIGWKNALSVACKLSSFNPQLHIGTHIFAARGAPPATKWRVWLWLVFHFLIRRIMDLKYLSPSSQEPVCQEGEGQSASGAEGSGVEAFWESPTKGGPHEGP